MGDRGKPRFTFKKKPPPPVETELDLDFVDITNDCSRDMFDDEDEDEITEVRDKDIQVVSEIKKKSEPKGETQKAWSDIMSKMRYQPKEVRIERQKDAAQQWGKLMGAMQKNQQKSFVSAMKSKSKNCNSKRQTKRTLANPNVKRRRSDNLIHKSTATITLKSPSTQITEIDLELSDLELSENIPQTTTKPTVEVSPKPDLPICPLFLPKSSSSSKTNTQSQLEDIKQRILEMKSSENPWTKQSSSSSNESWLPEVVQLNNLGGAEPEKPEKQGGKVSKRAPKTCPFYKMLPGTKFSVDAFDCGVIPGIDVYFLSHFHSDHYKGLTKKFGKTIICSSPTGNLVTMKLGVAEHCIRRLELNKVYIVQGVEVVLIDANHCPGSVMFMLRLPNSTNYLHTGDFRYTSDMLENHFLHHLRVDSLYLDTTYCDPQYDFPLQNDAIALAVLTVKKHLANKPKTLICVGSYCIGKERVFCAIADAIGSKVYCDANKRRVLCALENPYFQQLLSDNESNCRVHVLEMSRFSPTHLSEYLQGQTKSYTNIFGVRPTGWEFARGAKSTGSTVRSFFNDTVYLMGVPYSEHSSFSELKEFVSIIKPVKVQPTVNVGNQVKREAMMSHIEQWLKDT